jgi:hypothetical protein
MGYSIYVICWRSVGQLNRLVGMKQIYWTLHQLTSTVIWEVDVLPSQQTGVKYSDSRFEVFMAMKDEVEVF